MLQYQLYKARRGMTRSVMTPMTKILTQVTNEIWLPPAASYISKKKNEKECMLPAARCIQQDEA